VILRTELSVREVGRWRGGRTQLFRLSRSAIICAVVSVGRTTFDDDVVGAIIRGVI
jgi:hypothetical protein